jgi:acyl-CoA hydrolase
MSNAKISHTRTGRTKYQSMIATPAEAVAKIKPGERVFVGTGCAEPLQLVDALTKRSRSWRMSRSCILLTFGEAPYAHEKLTQSFRVNSFFIAENVRSLIQEGLGDYTPIFLSDLPRLFDSGQLPIDVALIQVTPPDAEGGAAWGCRWTSCGARRRTRRW